MTVVVEPDWQANPNHETASAAPNPLRVPQYLTAQETADLQVILTHTGTLSVSNQGYPNPSMDAADKEVDYVVGTMVGFFFLKPGIFNLRAACHCANDSDGTYRIIELNGTAADPGPGTPVSQFDTTSFSSPAWAQNMGSLDLWVPGYVVPPGTDFSTNAPHVNVSIDHDAGNALNFDNITVFVTPIAFFETLD